MSFDKVFNSIIREATRKFDYDKDGDEYPIEDEEHPINVVDMDDHHQYETIDGVTYELGLNGTDKVVKISDVYSVKVAAPSSKDNPRTKDKLKSFTS